MEAWGPGFLEHGGVGKEVPSEPPEEGGAEEISGWYSKRTAGFLSYRKPLKYAEPLQGSMVALERLYSCLH